MRILLVVMALVSLIGIACAGEGELKLPVPKTETVTISSLCLASAQVNYQRKTADFVFAAGVKCQDPTTWGGQRFRVKIDERGATYFSPIDKPARTTKVTWTTIGPDISGVDDAAAKVSLKVIPKK